MKRVRTITAAGVLTGATVLGGVSLAGAESHDGDAIEGTEVLEEVSTELTTGEPEAPTLPDTAADQATTALEQRFAGASAQGGEDDADADSETGGDATTEETAEVDDAEQGEHGAHVSSIASAKDDETHGRDHGEAVSTAARSHGEAQREQGGDEPAEQEEELEAADGSEETEGSEETGGDDAGGERAEQARG